MNSCSRWRNPAAPQPRTGWMPRHLILEDSRGRTLGAHAAYFARRIRAGEFVFDFSWANAYAQHGMKYYPKLLSAVPFTPVSGPRLLVSPHAADARAVNDLLIRAARDYARSEQLSSWHILFPADERPRGIEASRADRAPRLPVPLA